MVNSVVRKCMVREVQYKKDADLFSTLLKLAKQLKTRAKIN